MTLTDVWNASIPKCFVSGTNEGKEVKDFWDTNDKFLRIKLKRVCSIVHSQTK